MGVVVVCLKATNYSKMIIFDATIILLCVTSCSCGEYVDYTAGKINLILAVPHNGNQKPPNIPDRQPGCKDEEGVCRYPGKENCSKSKICKVVTFADSHTKEIAKVAYDTFVENTGMIPHMVVNNVHRGKMDPNTPTIEGAAQGNNEAIDAYEAYHGTINTAKESFDGQPGLLIDFHGQVHKQNSTEIGYLIRKEDLNEGTFDIEDLSIRSLVERRNGDPDCFVFGTESLGALFEAAGYKAVPSPRQHFPGTDKYFNGGFTTKEHGSRDNGGNVDAIQMEIPSEIRGQGGRGLRIQFAKDLAKIIEDFYTRNYI